MMSTIINTNCKDASLQKHLLTIYRGLKEFSEYWDTQSPNKTNIHLREFRIKFYNIINYLCPTEENNNTTFHLIETYYLLHKVGAIEFLNILRLPAVTDKKYIKLFDLPDEMLQSWIVLRNTYQFEDFKENFVDLFEYGQQLTKDDPFYK